MLVETFEYAVNNREEILSRIEFEEHESILRKARELWTDYDPSSEGGSARLVGIDSSWNFVPYQGFYIYAVDAVSIQGDGTYLVPPLIDVNLSTLSVKSGEDYISSPQLALESIGMDYEFEQARSCMGKADYILVDGSVLARYYDRKRKEESSSFHETAKELMQQEGMLYISKKSFSNTALRGGLGDMFYFNRVSTRPGYSSPFTDRSGVAVSYLRLAEDAPCIKLEIPGSAGKEEIERLMDLLAGDSVEGYPYVLRLAHERGKISHEEMGKIARLLGLEVEFGGRQVLGE
jgi:hypothetical protein